MTLNSNIRFSQQRNVLKTQSLLHKVNTKAAEEERVCTHRRTSQTCEGPYNNPTHIHIPTQRERDGKAPYLVRHRSSVHPLSVRHSAVHVMSLSVKNCTSVGGDRYITLDSYAITWLWSENAPNVPVTAQKCSPFSRWLNSKHLIFSLRTAALRDSRITVHLSLQ